MTPTQIVLLVLVLAAIVLVVVGGVVAIVFGWGSLAKGARELAGQGEKREREWYAQEWTPEKARLELKKLERELARIEKAEGLDELQKAFGMDELVHQQIDFLRERLAQFERAGSSAGGFSTDPIGKITAELEARVRTLGEWEALRATVNEDFKERFARDPEFKATVDRAFETAKMRILTERMFGSDKDQKV